MANLMANLVKDGLVWADETPLEHLLLSIRVSHRVTDVEQLRVKIIAISLKYAKFSRFKLTWQSLATSA